MWVGVFRWWNRWRKKVKCWNCFFKCLCGYLHWIEEMYLVSRTSDDDFLNFIAETTSIYAYKCFQLINICIYRYGWRFRCSLCLCQGNQWLYIMHTKSISIKSAKDVAFKYSHILFLAEVVHKKRFTKNRYVKHFWCWKMCKCRFFWQNEIKVQCIFWHVYGDTSLGIEYVNRI